MPAKVADASVVAAMIFQEPRAQEALSLLRDSELCEPTLLAYELASIARKKVLRYPEQRDALLEALEVAISMDINWVEVEQAEVLKLALETGLTTYDASYLYVARSLGMPLVTFDEQLQAADREGGV